MCDEKIVLKENTHEIQVVGKLKQEYIDALKISLPCAEIYMYPGAIKHLKKKHNEDFKKYFHSIPEIIEKPDYIGVNPKEPNSIELVKVIEKDVLVAVKLDPSGYLYFSSMYELTPSKVPKRLASGRLIKLAP